MESSNFSKEWKVSHVAEIQIVKKVEVNKAAAHVSRQEHNLGCVYVCIKAFRKAPHFI